MWELITDLRDLGFEIDLTVHSSGLEFMGSSDLLASASNRNVPPPQLKGRFGQREESRYRSCAYDLAELGLKLSQPCGFPCACMVVRLIWPWPSLLIDFHI